MNSTHRFATIFAVAALLAGAPAQASWLHAATVGPIDWDGDQQQTEKFSKTVPLPKGGSLTSRTSRATSSSPGDPGTRW